jgi:hypothetical protein
MYNSFSSKKDIYNKLKQQIRYELRMEIEKYLLKLFKHCIQMRSAASSQDMSNRFFICSQLIFTCLESQVLLMITYYNLLILNRSFVLWTLEGHLFEEVKQRMKPEKIIEIVFGKVKRKISSYFRDNNSTTKLTSLYLKWSHCKFYLSL